MIKKIILTLLLFVLISPISVFANKVSDSISAPFKRVSDTRAKEIKYQYEVLKADEEKNIEGKIYNRTPSGYMTVDEYEALSEYKDRSTQSFDIPKIEKPSDFKYVPQPLYKIVKYNNPPGSVELSLGKKLYLKRMINAQGIVSPDYMMLIYPTVYYYPDSASVACDLFMIILDSEDTNLNRILKANVAKRVSRPILSTEKAIDNFAAFRTLTPVDFSEDGTKLLVKEKIGSQEDGIWETKAYVYDFNRRVSYDLQEVRDSITYFWKEYMDVNLDDRRWDIIPLGFDKNDPTRIVVQGYAYTGSTPIYLGAWSIDWQGHQSRLISFKKDFTPAVSENGYKVVRDGVEAYTTVQRQEKMQKAQGKVLEKQKKAEDKKIVDSIKEEGKYNLRSLKDDYKMDIRDYKKLQTLKGSTEDTTVLDKAYEKYLNDQWAKDVIKTQKEIDKAQRNLDKTNQKIEKLNTNLENFSNNKSSDENSSDTH